MNPSIKHIPVKDVMKTSFTTIDRSATIQEALEMMKALRTSVLVVNKRNDDDEYGILVISDIARKVLAKDKPPQRTNVYEVMIKPAVCVEPDMDIRYCSRLFARFDLVRVLVVKEGRVLGTLSPNGLVLEGLFSLGQE
jgi:signal-transduction protein with cAMP-binding, CBS, and nucleotidyltransferase domain